MYTYIYIYMNSPIVCQYIPAIQNLGQSVIVEKDRQNGRERKSFKLFLWAIDFPFENE